MNKEEIKFQISQLRLDKIIYAVEAVAVNITCLAATVFVRDFLVDKSFQYPYSLINPIILSFGVIYTLYALIGNLFRLIKVKKLEKLL